MLTFSVVLPEQTPVAGTKAVLDTDIENIDLLVFDENQRFLERTEAYNIAGSGNVKTFNARLDISNQPRTVHFVANGRDASNADRLNFSVLTPGMLQSTAIPALQTLPVNVSLSMGQAAPLVMWGRVTVPSVSASTTVNGVKLLRSSACVKVQVAAADASNGLADFSLEAFSVHKGRGVGKLAPADYTVSSVVPATPNPAGPDIDYYTYGSGYWAVPADPALYLYERTNTTSDYLSLIVKATYAGQSGYYRVALVDGNGVPVDIVRNHRYIVTVVKALGPGFPTPAAAAANTPSNALKVSIVDANDDIHILVADGGGELGISNSTIVVRSGSTANSLPLATVFATRTAGLSVSSTCPGLTNVQLSAPVNGISQLTAQANGSTGSGAITVTDGSLRLVINANVLPFTSGLTDIGPDHMGLQLMTTANRPWQAEAVGAYIWLNTAASPSGTYPGGLAPGWCYTFLESRMNTAAYIYVHKSAAVLGYVKYSRMNGSDQEIGRWVFNR